MKCTCSNGIHDGNRIDCDCSCHEERESSADLTMEYDELEME